MGEREAAWAVVRDFEDAVEDWCETAGMAQARAIEVKREAVLALCTRSLDEAAVERVAKALYHDYWGDDAEPFLLRAPQDRARFYRLARLALEAARSRGGDEGGA